MEFILVDFGTIEQQVKRFTKGASLAVETESVMTEILADMFTVEKNLFNSQGRRGGGSWAKLKPDTVKRKGNTTIYKTSDAAAGYASGDDALIKSLTEPDAPYQEAVVTRDTISFGTNHPHAAVLNFGSDSRGIPARPLIKFTDRDLDRWSDMIFAHLMAPFQTAEATI